MINVLALLRVCWCIFVASCSLLTGCSPTYLPVVNSSPLGEFPDHPVYVLAGRGSYNGFANNSLTIIDADTWKVYRRVAILRSRVKNFSRDPQGRIWIGYSGGSETSDSRVQVFSTYGDLVTTLQTCIDPEAGINFAVERAFIVCAENGFFANVEVINLNTLKHETTFRVETADSPFLAISSVTNENTLVIYGGRYLVLVDTTTLIIREQLGPLEEVFWQMLADGDKFYLLNSASFRSSKNPRPDLVVVDTSNVLNEQSLTLTRSPLWGRIVGHMLYTFHNPTWGETINDPWRAISKTDLTTGEFETWNLPEVKAYDLDVVNEKIIISLWWADDGSKDGLYEFDPNTGELKLLVNSIGAEKIIVVDD